MGNSSKTFLDRASRNANHTNSDDRGLRRRRFRFFGTLGPNDGNRRLRMVKPRSDPRPARLSCDAGGAIPAVNRLAIAKKVSTL